MGIAELLKDAIPGLLTGGTAAGSTFLGVFKSLKKRLHDLEKDVGEAETEPPTGIFYQLDVLNKGVRTLRNEINSWRDEPPDWLVRIVQRANRGSMTNEGFADLEQRVDARLNSLKGSVQRLEDDLDRREARLEDAIGKSSPEFHGLIMRDEYDRDSKMRAKELQKVQDSLRSSNAFLRGIMAAMGYVDAPKTEDSGVSSVPSTPPPPPPPRPNPLRLPTPARSFPIPQFNPKKPTK